MISIITHFYGHHYSPDPFNREEPSRESRFTAGVLDALFFVAFRPLISRATFLSLGAIGSGAVSVASTASSIIQSPTAQKVAGLIGIAGVVIFVILPALQKGRSESNNSLILENRTALSKEISRLIRDANQQIPKTERVYPGFENLRDYVFEELIKVLEKYEVQQLIPSSNETAKFSTLLSLSKKLLLETGRARESATSRAYIEITAKAGKSGYSVFEDIMVQIANRSTITYVREHRDFSTGRTEGRAQDGNAVVYILNNVYFRFR